ncbi:hypothetical protein DVJ78_13730 [Humibacter sp. BT305]|nr:hypothetical protein DVJ78_13730 [Humibacter sp. BT305]
MVRVAPAERAATAAWASPHRWAGATRKSSTAGIPFGELHALPQDDRDLSSQVPVRQRSDPIRRRRG